MNSWHLIGKIKPQTLVESRVQLHYAIQLIAATGAALAEPLPDYSHTSLVWDPVLELFVGSPIRAARFLQIALEPVSLSLILVDKQRETMTSLPLHGRTLAEGLRWLQEELARIGVDASSVVFLDYPPDDFPDHPLAHGAVFDASQDLAFSELVDYYANTHQLLQNIMATVEDVTAIRIWPHHFDMAMLVMLPGTRNGSPNTIGVGLSPGDTSYAEPYWYVSPYPYPATTALPAIAGNGFWHTQGWVGAVLPATRLIEPVGNEAQQQQQVEAFLHAAVEAAIALLQEGSVQV